MKEVSTGTTALKECCTPLKEWMAAPFWVKVYCALVVPVISSVRAMLEG
jgi:hypothetical protein